MTILKQEEYHENNHNQMTAELELLRNLADAEENVISGRVSPIKETFDSIRENLIARSGK